MTVNAAGNAGQPRLISRVSAAVYDRLTNGLERQLFGPYRRKLLAACRGRVLDVGAGTGANLPNYPRQGISELVLLDPSPGMLARAGRKAAAAGLPVLLQRGQAEQMPWPDNSFDTVVFTLSLCTITDPGRALAEASRVLRPKGRLLVMEHVRAQAPGLARWQDRFTPLWKTLNGGCHLNRPTRATIEAAGFAFTSVQEFRETRIPLAFIQPMLIGVGQARQEGGEA